MFEVSYDREASTEIEPKYFVYESFDNVVVYKGTYIQCLCIVGSFSLYPEMTIEEIREKTGGFV